MLKHKLKLGENVINKEIKNKNKLLFIIHQILSFIITQLNIYFNKKSFYFYYLTSHNPTCRSVLVLRLVIECLALQANILVEIL